MTKKKTPKPYNWDSKLMAAIRKVWRFSPERREAFERATIEKGTVVCSACGSVVDKRLAQADHADPVVPLSGFDSWDNIIARMRTGTLMILCDPCHSAKTKAENAKRAEFRRLVKAQNKPEKKRGKKCNTNK